MDEKVQPEDVKLIIDDCDKVNSLEYKQKKPTVVYLGCNALDEDEELTQARSKQTINKDIVWLLSILTIAVIIFVTIYKIAINI